MDETLLGIEALEPSALQPLDNTFHFIATTASSRYLIIDAEFCTAFRFCPQLDCESGEAECRRLFSHCKAIAAPTCYSEEKSLYAYEISSSLDDKDQHKGLRPNRELELALLGSLAAISTNILQKTDSETTKRNCLISSASYVTAPARPPPS
jgi:hypothetical protein